MTPKGHDPYCYPGTNVLINLKGFHDLKALQDFEAQSTATAIAGLHLLPLQGPFHIARLRETHRRIFARVYAWAGEFRTGIGMMAKERSGFTVAYGPSANVPAALEGVFARLQSESELRGLDREAFARRLAYFYSELDAIHPFREGNSRTLRAFTGDLAENAGLRLDWSRVGPSEQDRLALYHARDLAVMRGDLAGLLKILLRCLTPA
jgi:cell filamentation protein